MVVEGVNVDVKNIIADLERSPRAESDCPSPTKKFMQEVVFLQPADVGSVHQYPYRALISNK